ncbi:unnamed protein product [Arctogadus glacialis]
MEGCDAFCVGRLAGSVAPERGKEGERDPSPLLNSSRPGGKGSIRCAVVSVGRAWTILLQRFHPGEKRGLALEDIIQEGRNGAKL